jgi:hypothetical protein
MKIPQDRLLTKEECCVKLSISMALLEKEIRKGRIRPIRITAPTIRFDPLQIDREFGIANPVIEEEEVTDA